MPTFVSNASRNRPGEGACLKVGARISDSRRNISKNVADGAPKKIRADNRRSLARAARIRAFLENISLPGAGAGFLVASGNGQGHRCGQNHPGSGPVLIHRGGQTVYCTELASGTDLLRPLSSG